MRIFPIRKRRSRPDAGRRYTSAFAIVIALLLIPTASVSAQDAVRDPIWGRGGFVPVFGGLSQTAGMTAGLRYDAFLRHPNYTLGAEALGSLRGYAGFRGVGGFQNESVAAFAYARYRYLPKEAFYGMGSENHLDLGSDYRLDDRVAGLSVALQAIDRVATGMHLSILDNRFGTGRDGDLPPIEDLHAVPGIGEDSRYMILGVWLELDGRELSRPRRLGYRFAPIEPPLRKLDLGVSRGWYLTAEVTPHVSTRDAQPDFLRAEFEGQLFLPTDFSSDGFAFRTHLALTGRGDERPPFYLLPALGGSSSIRGFRPDRFRADHALLFNVEYRSALLLFLDAAAFVDAGQTFDAASDIALNEMEFGYGLGLRVRVGRFILGRIDVARSREGVRMYIRAGTFL